MFDEELHKRCISSTDLGPIFGVDDYRDAWTVAASKRGMIRHDPPTWRMRVGKAIEQLIVQRYGELAGVVTEFYDQTIVNDRREWMAATPDAFVVTRSGGRNAYTSGVDAKYVHWDQRRKWGETPNDIPMSVQLQMWWMMAVCELDTWDVAALVGDDEPIIYHFERDQEAERVMIARAEEFHRRYVIGDELPEIGGSEAATAWLQQAFPNHKRPDMRFATDEEALLLDNYVELRCQLRDMLREKDSMENALRQAVGDKEGILWTDGRFTWRKTKDRTKVDWKSIAIGLMSHLPEDEREFQYSIHTTTEPGPRRILLTSDRYRESAKDHAANEQETATA